MSDLGTVYILETGDERYIKIGFTTRLALRLQEIQCTMFAHEHGGILVIGFFPASHAVEVQLHRQFDRWRFHGDWYERGPVLEQFAFPLLPAVDLPVKCRFMTSTEFQSAGGKARAAQMTAEERTAIARKAGAARWAKRKAA